MCKVVCVAAPVFVVRWVCGIKLQVSRSCRVSAVSNRLHVLTEANRRRSVTSWRDSRTKGAREKQAGGPDIQSHALHTCRLNQICPGGGLFTAALMGSKTCLPELDRHHSAGKETAGLKPLVSSSCFCFQIAPELEKVKFPR